MSDDATSSAARQRTLGPWWFGAALLTAVILVVVGVQLIRQHGLVPATPARCDAAALASNDIPAGAVSISLCDNPVEPTLAMATPPDALVEDIAEVVHTYRNLPRTGGEICTDDLGPRFDLVFSYAGRDPVRLTGELYGCAKIGERHGAGAVLATFLDRLQAQRAHQQPWPGPVTPPECPVENHRWSYRIPAPAELIAGQLCVVAHDEQLSPIRPVALSGREWTTLRDDLAANSHPDDPNTAESGDCDRSRYLVATNAFGEQMNIQIHCSGQAWWSSTVRGGNTMRWDPSPTAWDVIDRLTR